MLVDRPDGIKPEVAAHLEACEGCRQEFALLQRLSASLRTVEAPPAPAYFASGVMARIAAEGKKDSRVRLGWVSAWKRFAVAAATVVMVAGSAFGIIRFAGVSQPPMVADNTKPPVVQPSNPTALNPLTNPDTSVKTPASQPENGTTLPDGTTGTQPTANNSEPGTQPTVDSPGTKTQPAVDKTETKTEPPKQDPVEIAMARTPRTFLSQQRVLSSTVLRIEVKDLAAVRTEALSAARSFEASGGISVANSSDGQYRTEMYQFIVETQKAENFLTALGALGMVTSRQDEQRDITDDFNNTKTQYLNLIASRNADPESAAEIDPEINGLEKYLSQLEASTGKRTVTLWLVQIP